MPKLSYSAHLLYFAIVTATWSLPQSPSFLATAAFDGCGLASDGLTYYRDWDSSPVTIQLTSGQEISLGDYSRFITFCDTCTVFPPATPCSCAIWVPTSYEDDTPDVSEYCSSCTLFSLDEFSFNIYWDCSNRISSACAGFDEYGCISNEAEVTPSPVRAPVIVATVVPSDIDQSNPSPVGNEAEVTPSPVSVPVSDVSVPDFDEPNPAPVSETDFDQPNPSPAHVPNPVSVPKYCATRSRNTRGGSVRIPDVNQPKPKPVSTPDFNQPKPSPASEPDFDQPKASPVCVPKPVQVPKFQANLGRNIAIIVTGILVVVSGIACLWCFFKSREKASG